MQKGKFFNQHQSKKKWGSYKNQVKNSKFYWKKKAVCYIASTAIMQIIHFTFAVWNWFIQFVQKSKHGPISLIWARQSAGISMCNMKLLPLRDFKWHQVILILSKRILHIHYIWITPWDWVFFYPLWPILKFI